jgi:hypothetical protein
MRDGDLLTVLVLRHGSAAPGRVRLAAPLTYQFDLDPGEVIVAGTPSGVALWLEELPRPGDSVKAKIEGIGTLHNHGGRDECSALVTPDEA